MGESMDGGARTVLEKLLSPPLVPDASWFAAASAALLRAAALSPLQVLILHARGTRVESYSSPLTICCGPPLPCMWCQVFTQPDQHVECMQLVECLRSGSFRTQSAVLEFLANSIGHSLSVGDEHDEGQLRPRILQALNLLVTDASVPVLSAALDLCREQPKVAGDEQASSGAGSVWKDGGQGEWVRSTTVTTGSAVRANASVHDSWGGGEGNTAFVQQKCCDDPTDCEEPAVSPGPNRYYTCILVVY